MRHLTGLAFVLILAACGAEGLPIGVNSPASTGDGGGVVGDGGGIPGDGGPVAPIDMAKPGNPAGGACKTACDCVAGLACRQGKCAMSSFGAVYCCGSSTCPGGSPCQSANGSFGQCGMGGGGGGGGGPGGGGGGGPGGGGGTFDGGAAFCAFIPCQSNSICVMSGCGSCDTSNGRCK